MPALPSLLLLAAPVFAGSGPWTLGPGDLTVYAGSEFSRSTQYRDGRTGQESLLTGNGVGTQGLKAIVTVGIADRFEVEAGLPYFTAHVFDEKGSRCDTLGLEPCASTRGFGVLTLRAKGLVVDQFTGPPVSMALGAELRQGEWTADTRHRLTGLGEGTTDIGAFASVGHTGGVGSGSWLASLEAGGRYRFTTSEVKATPIPGPEAFGTAEVLMGPGRVLLGPAASGLYRGAGVDLSTTDYSTFDRFSAVRVTTVSVGGKALVYGEQGGAVVLGAMYSVAAVNNPSDLLLLSVGVSMYRARPEVL